MRPNKDMFYHNQQEQQRDSMSDDEEDFNYAEDVDLKM